jgi:hypothetical protein
MSQHTSNNKLAGGLLLGAVASGSLALAALSGAATANAGCVSVSGATFVSGLGLSGLCATSTEPGNIAVANGPDAFAIAGVGPGNTAIAAGTIALAQAGGAGNFALAHGDPGANPGAVFIVPPGAFIVPAGTIPTAASATGVLNKAFAIGNGSTANAINIDFPVNTVGNNRATTIGNGSNSLAVSGNQLIPPIAAGQIANAIGNNVNSLNMP